MNTEPTNYDERVEPVNYDKGGKGALDYIRGFLSQSESYRNQFVDVWSECESNYFLQPKTDIAGSRTEDPLNRMNDMIEGAIGSLRDPESRSIADTWASRLELMLLPQTADYVAAKPHGREDAVKAETVTRLLHHVLRQPENRTALVSAINSAVRKGTGIVHVYWKYETRPQTITGVDVDELGIEIPEAETITESPVFDDVRLDFVDLMDFFPDPHAVNLDDATGAARSFEITAEAALDMAERGIYSYPDTEDAIRNGRSFFQAADKQYLQSTMGRQLDLPDGVKTLEGIEYWGLLPADLYPYGENWRTITILNGVIVRDEPWVLNDRRIPFYDIRVNPVTGRFYGLGVLEPVRHLQDFADWLLNQIMDLVHNRTNPPWVYDSRDSVDLTPLETKEPNALIPSDNPGAIKALQVGGDVGSAFSMYERVKQLMREASGALGILQGQPLENSRTSVAEVSRTFQSAETRLEANARAIESRDLIRMGQGILALYQRYVTDTTDLARRLGEAPEMVSLADIHSLYDIEFVGARNHITKAQKISTLPFTMQLLALGNQYSLQIPGDQILVELLEALGHYKAAQFVSTPDTVAVNSLLQQIQSQLGSGQQFGNGNGTLPAIPGGTPAENLGTTVPPGQIV